MAVALTIAALGGCRDSRELPTTSRGDVGDLLRQWWREGTAAGNVGDWYDNRDDGHSDLDTDQWPQLQRITYSFSDIWRRRNWGVRIALLQKVVFGNSSSAFAAPGGSNPMYYYVTWKGGGLSFLNQQYRGNNLYIYPAHHDHEPGHNGKPSGYGDVFPTNTPYLIISQGSSWSDQPFLRALPNVLAAFQPDVKRTLVANGTLMPTIQWILRTTNPALKDPDDYLTGLAHPTAFDGTSVDDLAMVEKAHALTQDTLPPLVDLHVVEEQQATEGVDYFDPGLTEQLGDSPGVIARVLRARNRVHRIVISAERSLDPNHRPLTFRWVVLRGDAREISITPQNAEGSVSELIVGWQPRRPIAPGSPLESNRVDIGVFAHNGSTYSPPAFVTFFSLDNETRTYQDDGRLVEIRYDRANFVDSRLTFPKEWRDVYRYDSKSRCIGWTRYDRGGQNDFNLDGRLIIEKDALGRALKARGVRYEQLPFTGEGVNPNALRFVPADELVTYAFADDDDTVGRVVSTTRINP